MNIGEFLLARSRYWRSIVAKYEPDLRVLPETEVPPPTTQFIIVEKGAGSSFGVFEDEGDTGYLYLFDENTKLITRHVHVYDRSPKLTVNKQDAEVLWSRTREKCGVMIWNKMRAIIDLRKDRPYRAWIVDRGTEGIDDPDWLEGFDFNPGSD